MRSVDNGPRCDHSASKHFVKSPNTRKRGVGEDRHSGCRNFLLCKVQVVSQIQSDDV